MKRRTLRKTRVTCKNCHSTLFQGDYTAGEYTELMLSLIKTRKTACCGNFQHGVFPVTAIYAAPPPIKLTRDPKTWDFPISRRTDK